MRGDVQRSNPPQPRAAAGQASPQPTGGASLGRRLLLTAAVAASYFATAELGLSLATTTKQVSAVWPPTGIAVVSLVLLGPEAIVGVWLGALAANLATGEAWYTALGIACGNTAGPWLARLLLRRVRFDPGLARVRDVMALLVLGGIVGMLPIAANGTLWLAVSGIVAWADVPHVFRVWWIGDAMGVLVVAPVLLGFAARQEQPTQRRLRRLELAALFVSATVVSVALLSHPHPLAYAVFPFAVWAALRFGPRETACVVLVIAGAALWGFAHGRGPFWLGTQQEPLVLLVFYLGVTSLTALLLAAAAAERRHAERELRVAQAELESRVAARTAELAHANSALSHTNTQLAHQSRELAVKNEEIEGFVYVVSHDLRAPLVNLSGFTEELRTSCDGLRRRLAQSALPPRLEADLEQIFHSGIDDSLRYIHTSSGKLQRLIEALLRLSRTGRDEYLLEPLSVEAIVRSSLDVLRPAIARSGATIDVGPLPDAMGDLTAIGQVFGNLIGNALNYLQRGRPGLIEIGGELQAGSSHFWVRDNGVGFNAAAHERMFQVFQRFHPELATGEGMGLAIVKRVVERHGGRVWAESQPGLGATFHVTLPAPSAERTGAWRKTA